MLLVALLLLLLLVLLNEGYGRIPLIEQYIVSHGASVMHAEVAEAVASKNASASALCQRRYILTQAYCHSSMGNELMMFLNNLALGVILNRTSLTHVDARSCDSKLVFAPWLPRYEDLMPTLVSTCGMNTYVELDFSLEERNSASPVLMACCVKEFGVDGELAPLMKVHRVDRMQASVLAYEGADILPEAAMRARDIFTIPSKGPLYGYGQLFQASLKFSKVVQRWNEHYTTAIQAMFNSTTRNTTVLGAHLRHQLDGDQGKLQGYEALKTLECMQSLLPVDRRDNCVIILATDRTRTLVEMQDWANNKKLRCQFMHSASSHEEDSTDFKLATAGGHGASKGVDRRSEHGPWGDSMLVFADMHLLSYSNFFVGSKGISTYASSLSILFGSIIAGKTGLARTQRFPPSCSIISFNGEIANATLLHSAGREAARVKGGQTGAGASDGDGAVAGAVAVTGANDGAVASDGAGASDAAGASASASANTSASASSDASAVDDGGVKRRGLASTSKHTVHKTVAGDGTQRLPSQSAFDEYVVENPVLKCNTPKVVDACVFNSTGHTRSRRLTVKRVSDVFSLSGW